MVTINPVRTRPDSPRLSVDSPIRQPRRDVGPRLTRRDEQLVRFISEHRVAPIRALAPLLAIWHDGRETISYERSRQVVDRCRRLGLVDTLRPFASSIGTLVVPTLEGTRLVGLPAPRPLSMTALRHPAYCACIASYYLSGGFIWWSERSIRIALRDEGRYAKGAMGTAVPDGAWASNNDDDHLVAVEIQLSLVGRTRFTDHVRTLLHQIDDRGDPLWPFVEYWAGDEEVHKTLERHLTTFRSEEQARVRLRSELLSPALTSATSALEIPLRLPRPATSGSTAKS